MTRPTPAPGLRFDEAPSETVRRGTGPCRRAGRRARAARCPATAPCWALLLALLAAGCGGPRTAPVCGKITVAGQPAKRGNVTFLPDESKGTSGKAATGDIQPDGTYTLGTFGTDDGALVGHHRVIVSGRAIEDDESRPPDDLIPPRYASPQRSGLTAEVKPGRNTLDFDLQP